MRNTNTLEDFKACDKNAFLQNTACMVWEDIQSGAALAEPSLLVSFSLLCFADLKKYTYTYWAAYPAFQQSWEYTDIEVFDDEKQADLQKNVSTWRNKTDATQWGFFVYHSETHQVVTLAEWESISENHRNFAFVDPSSAENSLGWPARNLLTLLAYKLRLNNVNITSYRGNRKAHRFTCRYNHLSVEQGSMPKPTGWERNHAGKLGPRIANLASVMDPSKLADDAVDLNLKLMKWRIAPDLNLQKVKDCKCLLLGAGTLGCYVSRLLLGWGVKTITFVDSGRVSFSNPVRQPLFKFSDCLDHGQPKAETAAEALKEIYPGVTARGHKLNVPMIGHPFTSASQGEADYKMLEELIDAHDAIFLLTDSRESRWLPTVMGAAKRKIVINAALGFDSYVVIRHGVQPGPEEQAEEEISLGCYFCNDVVAPTDSTSDRSLDQQCTVTRPGLAASASSTAVELLVSILQHPRGPRCSPKDQSMLGSIPHTVRGSLRTWENRVLEGHRFPYCSACGDAVITAYREGGWDFVRQACEKSGWVEELSGLKSVQDGIEGIDVDWESGSSDAE